MYERNLCQNLPWTWYSGILSPGTLQECNGWNFWNPSTKSNEIHQQRWIGCSCNGEITSARNHPPSLFFVTPLNFALSAAGHYHLAAKLLPRNPQASSTSSTHTMTMKQHQCDRRRDEDDVTICIPHSIYTDFTRRQGTSSYDDGIVLRERIKLWQMSA